MSYKIYAGIQTDVDVWKTKACIYDPSDITETKKLISPTLTRGVGKAGSLEFTLPLGNVAHSALQKLRTTVEVEQDGVSIWQGRPMSHEQDFLLRQKVYCEGELAYLNDSSVALYSATSVTIPEFLAFLCKNHNMQVDRYKHFTCGDISSGELCTIPVLHGASLKMSRSWYEENPNGPDYMDVQYSDWDLISSRGKVLISDFYTRVDGTSAPEPDSEEAVNSVYGKAILIRTAQNVFDMQFLAAYSTETKKTYNATPKSRTASIKSALCDMSFGPYTEYDISARKTSGNLSISEGPGGYIVFANGTKDPDFTTEDFTYWKKYDFGDGTKSGITWDVLQSELMEKCGGYLFVRHESKNGTPTRYLDWKTTIKEKNSQPIAFGTNLLDLTSYVKAEKIVTRVIAVGKTTKSHLFWTETTTITATANDTAAQKIFGIVTRVLVIDGTSSTKQSLQDAADEELAKNIRYLDGMAVKAVDLRDAGYDVTRFCLGKMTHIYSSPHGVDTWLLLSKLIEPMDKPEKKEFSFGIDFSSISDLQALSARKASDAYDLSRAIRGYVSDEKAEAASKEDTKP